MKGGTWTTEEVGQVLRRARRSAGMTRLEAADNIGNATSNIWGWEQGHHCPNAAAFLNALELYGFTLTVQRPRPRRTPDATRQP